MALQIGEVAQRLVVEVADVSGCDLVGGDLVAQALLQRVGELQVPAFVQLGFHLFGIVDEVEDATLELQGVGSLLDGAVEEILDHARPVQVPRQSCTTVQPSAGEAYVGGT